MDKKVNVSEFTSYQPDLKSITCRAAGSVGTPDNISFEQYIHDAFVSELKLADKYDKNSPITIHGHLEKVDFNSNIGTAEWTFTLKATSTNSKSIIVNSTHEFSGSFVADKACQEVAQEFVPAVQQLIKDLVTNPEFHSLHKT
jgi:predicted NAD/FAD-dependent oxidoreductase